VPPAFKESIDMKALIFAVPLALAAPALAQAPAQTMPASAFVKAAGASDLYERQSSQLVLQTTKNDKVRSFATMMLKDHANSTAMVKTAATQAGVKPTPPMLTPSQQKMIADLRAQTGTARDTAYISQQKQAHEQALALHTGYARSGDAAPLKAVAAKIAPVVDHHLAMLKGM
jgi:putative membrane protein